MLFHPMLSVASYIISNLQGFQLRLRSNLSCHRHVHWLTILFIVEIRAYRKLLCLAPLERGRFRPPAGYGTLFGMPCLPCHPNPIFIIHSNPTTICHTCYRLFELARASLLPYSSPYSRQIPSFGKEYSGLPPRGPSVTLSIKSRPFLFFA